MFRKVSILLAILAIFTLKPAYGFYLEYHSTTNPSQLLEHHWDALWLTWVPGQGYEEATGGNVITVGGVLFSVEADPGDALDELVTVRVTRNVVTDVDVSSSNFSDIDYGYEPPDFPMSVTELVTLNVGEVFHVGGYPYLEHSDVWLNSYPSVIDDSMRAEAEINGNYQVYADIELVPDATVPEPSVFWLFGTGLMGIGMIRSRLKNNQKN